MNKKEARREEVRRAHEYLQQCLALGSKFENPPVVLDLELASDSPKEDVHVGARDIAASTGIQCYSPGVAHVRPRPDGKAQDIADSTLKAGHNTLRQHAYYTWSIRMSRASTHDFFHDFPFYNSDLQSQRYVEAKFGNFLIPADLSPEQRGAFVQLAEFENAAYFELLKLLKPDIDKRMHQVYPENGWNVDSTKIRLDEKADKLGQEIARYMLPVAQLGTLHYTINELQLIRMFKASAASDVSDESRYVLAKMIEKLAEKDPQVLEDLQEPITIRRSYGKDEKSVADGKREFDGKLGEGRTTVLEHFDQNSRQFLADSVRNVMGMSQEDLTDEEALNLLMNPEVNPFLADVIESGINDPVTKCLRMVQLSFMTKMSLAGNEQRHRHRGITNATPPLESLWDGAADFFVPMIIRENPELKKWYEKKMEVIFDGINRLIEMGVDKKTALILLPNATNIRVMETGDLFDFFHFLKLRLCYTAQEEIFFGAVEKAEQIIAQMPEARMMLMAPCALRQKTGIPQRCPEGARWCGAAVYNLKGVEEYKDNRVI